MVGTWLVSVTSVNADITGLAETASGRSVSGRGPTGP